jgi:hypothetical protein
MSPLLFSRSARRAAQNDIRPGNRYRRPLGTHSGAIATVLELCPDLVGIPHVRFTVAVERIQVSVTRIGGCWRYNRSSKRIASGYRKATQSQASVDTAPPIELAAEGCGWGRHRDHWVDRWGHWHGGTAFPTGTDCRRHCASGATRTPAAGKPLVGVAR